MGFTDARHRLVYHRPTYTDTGYRPHEIERFRKSLQRGDTLRIRCMVPSLGEASGTIRRCTCRVAGIYPHVVLLTHRTRQGEDNKGVRGLHKAGM